MSQDDLAERLDAVERRLDAAYPEPTEGAVDSDTIERVERFAERLADLEAAVEAVEGYVGEIERVDEELERRADAALATADDLEGRLDSIESKLDAAPAQTAPDLDGRLAEQTAALEELRSEVGTLDGRVSALEPDADEDHVGHDVTSAGDRAHQCTCTEPRATELDGTAGFETRRSAADGGFERPNRTAPATTDPAEPHQPDDWTATDEPRIGPEPTASSDAPDPTIGRNDRSGPLGSTRDSHEPVGHGQSTGLHAPAENSTVSGWGEGPTDSPRPTELNGNTVRGDPAAARSPDPDDDRDWADANSETLLDRLRSLL